MPVSKSGVTPRPVDRAAPGPNRARRERRVGILDNNGRWLRRSSHAHAVTSAAPCLSLPKNVPFTGKRESQEYDMFRLYGDILIQFHCVYGSTFILNLFLARGGRRPRRLYFKQPAFQCLVRIRVFWKIKNFPRLQRWNALHMLGVDRELSLQNPCRKQALRFLEKIMWLMIDT